jgi:PadR family transcriptional regulator PadR
MAERIESMRLELRRGALVLAVLRVLNQEHYGYSLRKLLQESGLDIEEGTLYPLIRRLESYRLLESRWSEGTGRKRRYYKISEIGRESLKELEVEWARINESLTQLQEKNT